MASEYDRYVRSEWEMFVGDATRGLESLKAVLGLNVSRVLDVGCGAGQDLLPFAASAFCVGVDLSPEAGHAMRELFRGLGLSAKVAFTRAVAEALPFQSASFDLVICRLALPYNDNSRSLAEMARVLCLEGVLLLKFHHARFYWRKFWSGLLEADVLSMMHAG